MIMLAPLASRPTYSSGHEHGFVLIGLAGPMDVVNLSLSLVDLGCELNGMTKRCACTEGQLPPKPTCSNDDYLD